MKSHTKQVNFVTVLVIASNSLKDSNIWFYGSLYHNGAYFIFGGVDSDIIARLDKVSKRWSLAGHLKSNRERHNVIYDGEVFLVVGGLGPV